MRELKSHLEIKTGMVARALAEHLRSDIFREKFCSWNHDEVPPADPNSWSKTEGEIKRRAEARFPKLVVEWEKENNVVADAIKDFTDSVLLKYQDYEQELAQLEQQPQVEGLRYNARNTANSEEDDDFPTIAVAISGIIFLPLNLAATLLLAPIAAAFVALENHPRVLLATSPLWAPIVLVSSILASPSVGVGLGIVAFAMQLRNDRKIKSYNENRTAVLHRVSSEYLNSLCHARVTDDFAERLMAPARECLEQVKEGLPRMIRLNQLLYDKLEVDKRSKEETKETYGRLREDCRTLKTKLTDLSPELFARPPIQVSEDTSDRNLGPHISNMWNCRGDGFRRVAFNRCSMTAMFRLAFVERWGFFFWSLMAKGLLNFSSELVFSGC